MEWYASGMTSGPAVGYPLELFLIVSSGYLTSSFPVINPRRPILFFFAALVANCFAGQNYFAAAGKCLYTHQSTTPEGVINTPPPRPATLRYASRLRSAYDYDPQKTTPKPEPRDRLLQSNHLGQWQGDSLASLGFQTTM